MKKNQKPTKKIRFANLIFELLLEMTFTFHRNVIKQKQETYVAMIGQVSCLDFSKKIKLKNKDAIGPC